MSRVFAQSRERRRIQGSGRASGFGDSFVIYSICISCPRYLIASSISHLHRLNSERSMASCSPCKIILAAECEVCFSLVASCIHDVPYSSTPQCARFRGRVAPFAHCIPRALRSVSYRPLHFTDQRQVAGRQRGLERMTKNFSGYNAFKRTNRKHCHLPNNLRLRQLRILARPIISQRTYPPTPSNKSLVHVISLYRFHTQLRHSPTLPHTLKYPPNPSTPPHTHTHPTRNATRSTHSLHHHRHTPTL